MVRSVIAISAETRSLRQPTCYHWYTRRPFTKPVLYTLNIDKPLLASCFHYQYFFPSLYSKNPKMKLQFYFPLLTLLSTVQVSHAWGALGHETVAYVAQNFVASETKTTFQNILNDTGTSYLASIATWADSFRYTKDGRYTAAFHFIDANDNPPSSCGVKYSRDCGDKGCVVGAIQNYVCHIVDFFWQSWLFKTSRVLNTSLSISERDIAAKVRGSPIFEECNWLQ